MNITIICPGKIKEKYFTDAIREYSKRMQRYANLTICEVKDEPTPENASPREKQQILEAEGQRILQKIKSDDYVIALAIKGKELSSEALSAFIAEKMSSGTSSLVFVIGGSLGLSDQVLARAQYKLSFSPMTFPHQLMRVILLEQIYRSFRIMRGEPYHK